MSPPTINMWWCFVVLCLGIHLNFVANGAPVAEAPPKEMVKYMKRFGYLQDTPIGSPDTETLITEEGFAEVVRQVQKFGGLPETGKLDEATLKLMDSPRCGVPDVLREHANNTKNSTSGALVRNKRYNLASKGWRKKHLTYFLSNWAAGLDREDVLRKLEKAFKVWSDSSPLTFSYKHSMDADLIIGFGRGHHGDNYPFDGRGNTLAHAFFPYQQEPYGGDIHFDDDESWTDQSKEENRKNTDGVDFFTVATHEIGHSLGLAHSSAPSSIMFPYYKGYDTNFRIGYDDIMGLYDLYVRNQQFEDQDEPMNPNIPVYTPRTNPYPTRAPSSTREPPTTQRPSTRRPDNRRTTPERRVTPRPRVTTNIPVIPTRAPRPTTTRRPTPARTTTPYVTPRTTTTYVTQRPTSRYATPRPTTPYVPTNGDRRRRPVIDPNRVGRNKTKQTPHNLPPTVCDVHFDAISSLRGEIFIFFKEFMWRLSERGIVKPGYPVKFHSFFNGLAKSVKKIDAIYQRPTDYNILIFSGKYFWTFTGNNFTRDSPRPISDLGVSADHVDAAMVWAKNGQTYFFSGDQYWKYDENKKAVESGYPMMIKSRWQGLPIEIDSAFTWNDSQTYFFKGSQYWRFNNAAVSVDENFPRNARQDWLACGM